MTDFGSTFEGEGPLLDLTAAVRTVEGPRAVAVDVARRFTYRRGHFPWAPDRGFDLWALLSTSGITSAYIEANIVEQCEQDERVEAADARVSERDARSFRVEVTLHLANGPFRFVLPVSQVTRELLSED